MRILKTFCIAAFVTAALTSCTSIHKIPVPTGIENAIKTLAASGIKDFGKLLAISANAAPMRRNVTIDEVGNAAAFMCSDLASGITGEVLYVDSGFHSIGMTIDAGE